MDFVGISAESLFLLAENRFQDSKAFYEENKKQINKTVVHPLKQLVADMTPAMLEIDSLMGGHVSRVRRDNRFTHDKSMYRENMWIVFMRDKRAYNWCLPAFYLDFSVARAEWGLGFYSATPAVMRALRRRVEADIPRAVAAVQAAVDAGFEPGGNPYAKPRSTAETPDLLRFIYDCRSVDFNRTEAPDFVANEDLPNRLLGGFQALAPIYALLMEAVEEAMGMRDV